MSLKPKLEIFLKDVQERKDAKRKLLEDIMAKSKTLHISAFEAAANDVLTLLNNETIHRDEEVVGLLALIVGLAGHIDQLYSELNSMKSDLEQVGIIGKELDTAKQTIAEREELFNRIEQTYQNMQKKETQQAKETEEIWKRQKERGLLV